MAKSRKKKSVKKTARRRPEAVRSVKKVSRRRRRNPAASSFSIGNIFSGKVDWAKVTGITAGATAGFVLPSVVLDMLGLKYSFIPKKEGETVGWTADKKGKEVSVWASEDTTKAPTLKLSVVDAVAKGYLKKEPIKNILAPGVLGALSFLYSKGYMRVAGLGALIRSVIESIEYFGKKSEDARMFTALDGMVGDYSAYNNGGQLVYDPIIGEFVNASTQMNGLGAISTAAQKSKFYKEN